MTDNRIWRALADSTRREILDWLRQRPHTTGELAERFAMSRFGVMKHLSVLVDAKLVLVRRDGRTRWNHLNVAPLVDAIDRWAGPYQRSWANSLLRIRDLSEKGTGERKMAHTQATPVDSPVPVSRIIHIEQEIEIDAPSERVFHALTAEIDAWWTHPYRIFAGQDSRIEFDARMGGALVERADGGEALWGTVTGLEAGRWIEVTGRIGMAGAVLAVVSFTVEPRAKGSLLTLSHRATGEVDEETQANYDAGWRELLAKRLVAHLRAHPSAPTGVGGFGPDGSDARIISNIHVVIVYVEDQGRIVDFFIEKLGSKSEPTPRCLRDAAGSRSRRRGRRPAWQC
jgi:DNA-binding transcriptional ArsR family regulator/uncharacterized protein YndB with AHSA1/START domain